MGAQCGKGRRMDIAEMHRADDMWALLAYLVKENDALRDHCRGLEERVAECEKSRRLLRRAQRFGRLGFWQWDARTGAVQYSDESRPRFARGVSPVQPCNWLLNVHGEDAEATEAMVRHGLLGQQRFALNYRRRCRGRSLHLHEEVAVGRRRNGEIVRLFGAVTDVSAHASALDKLRAARQAAERVVSAKSNLIAAASHDLRQPFQAMRLLFDVLLQRLDDPAAHGVALKLGEAIGAGHRLLDNLLDYSTLEAGALVPRPSRFVLGDVLSRVGNEMAVHAAAKGLDFRVVPSPVVVESDPVLLERILRNFAGNAIRYTQHGGVLVGCRPRGAGLLLGVWDTGPGIPADRLDTIFKDFSRLGCDADAGDRGAGLGLAIVQRIAHLLGHEVAVRSVIGRGSCFGLRMRRAA